MKAACGHVFKYGDNVDTDVIIPARYLNSSDPKELATHCMEDIDKDFVKNVKEGDIIVANKNFGCGSSREHAPISIKAAGVSQKELLIRGRHSRHSCRRLSTAKVWSTISIRNNFKIQSEAGGLLHKRSGLCDGLFVCCEVAVKIFQALRLSECFQIIDIFF